MKYIVIFNDGTVRKFVGCKNILEAVQGEMQLNPDKEIISISRYGYDEEDFA